MYRHNRKTIVSKTFRDYLVPFIGLLLIIILIISFFSGENKQEKNINENRIGIDINLGSEDTDAYIEYIGGEKKSILSNTKLYKGEKVFVKEGNVILDFPQLVKMRLNRMGNLKFNEDGSFSLFASDLWINTLTDTNLKVRFGEVLIGKDSILSVTQNEVATTIYLLKGVVEVKNIAGKSTMLGGGKKITISSVDANKKDIDLSLLKNNLDDYFRGSDWYIKNNGDLYLNNIETSSGTITGTGDITTISKNKGYFIVNSLKDESQISSSKIAINGDILDNIVSKITINGIETLIDSDKKIFSLKELIVDKKVNDIIFKVYDNNSNILQKKVYTLYYSGGEKNIKSKFKVENFSLDSTKFQFIFPKENPYTTYTNLVTIEGKVPPGIVEKILVNDYKLQKFPKNGSYWKYHANKDFGNLKEGLNIYKVEYYGANNKLLHSNAFTIIKKSKEKLISDEATIQ